MDMLNLKEFEVLKIESNEFDYLIIYLKVYSENT